MQKIITLANGNVTAINDGSDSGLDADLLDGRQSTDYSLATFNVENLTAQKNLTINDARYQYLSNLSTQIVNLPLASTAVGKEFFIVNTGTVDIHLYENNVSTSIFLREGGTAYCHSAGAEWQIFLGSSLTGGGANSNFLTPTEILNSINLVDGSGSGLDADLLDGLHASQFVRTDANSNIPTSTLSFGSNTRQMLNLWSTGYGIGVQLGTTYFRTGSNFAFYIGGSHDNTELSAGSGGITPFYLNTTKGQFVGDTYLEFGPNSSFGGFLRVGTNGYTANQNNIIANIFTSSGNLFLDPGGDKAVYLNYHGGTSGVFFCNGNNSIVASVSNTGVYTQLSDSRAKEEVHILNYGLREILLLNPVAYKWKNDCNKIKRKELGLIAQDVKKIIPEVVSELQDAENKNKEFLGLDYTKLIPVLINAIKELKLEIEDLKIQNRG